MESFAPKSPSSRGEQRTEITGGMCMSHPGARGLWAPPAASAPSACSGPELPCPLASQQGTEARLRAARHPQTTRLHFGAACRVPGPVLAALSTWSPGARPRAGCRLLRSPLATEGPARTLGHPEPWCLPCGGEPTWKFVCVGLRLQTATVPNGLRFSVARVRLGDGRGAWGARLPTAGGDLRCLRPASEASRTSFPTGAPCVPTCSPSGPPAAPPRCWVPPTSRPLLMPGTHPAPDGNRLLPNPPQEPPGRAQKLPGAPGGMRPCPPLAVPNTSWLPTALSQRWFPVGVFHHPGVGDGGSPPRPNPAPPNDGDNRGRN